MNGHKKAQSVLEYSLLVAVLVGTLLVMRFYIQRSVQGQIQLYGDQLGDQYQVADTKNYEYYKSQASTTELNAPGFDHPTTSTTVSGSYGAYKKRELRFW